MIKTYDLSPIPFFGQEAEPDTMVGGDPEENARITRAILDGEPGPKQDVVVFNAGAALMAAGKAKDVAEGIEMAKAAIENGSARGKLDALVEYTQENG